LAIDDLWKNRVLNVDSLGEGEKALWSKIEPILNEVLDELKTNGKTETSFVKSQYDHLGSVLDNLNQVALNSNLLIDAIGKQEEFVEANAKFGFDDPKLANLYVQLTVLQCVLNTELFKALLLFHLKEVNRKASSFNRTMAQFAPKSWEKLRSYVDNDFRNSLAHGTWSIENKVVVLFNDSEFIPYSKLDLADFVIRTKNQNVLFVCLENVLADRKRTDFFT